MERTSVADHKNLAKIKNVVDRHNLKSLSQIERSKILTTTENGVEVDWYIRDGFEGGEMSYCVGIGSDGNVYYGRGRGYSPKKMEEVYKPAIEQPRSVLIPRSASIIASLDEIADEFESMGNLKLAYEIDKISDRLEEYGKDTFEKKEIEWEKTKNNSKVGPRIYPVKSISDILNGLYMDSNRPSSFYYMDSPEVARSANKEHGTAFALAKHVDENDIREHKHIFFVWNPSKSYEKWFPISVW
jgi:hypothetical protein